MLLSDSVSTEFRLAYLEVKILILKMTVLYFQLSWNSVFVLIW